MRSAVVFVGLCRSARVKVVRIVIIDTTVDVCGYLPLQAGFPVICHSKADYQERGPSIARHNAVFSM